MSSFHHEASKKCILTSFPGQLQIIASFRAFDRDHSGSLTKDELHLKLKTLLRTKNDGTIRSQDEVDAMDADVKKILDEVFTLMDTNGDGQIDIDEYVKGFSQNPAVIEFINDLRK